MTALWTPTDEHPAHTHEHGHVALHEPAEPRPPHQRHRPTMWVSAIAVVLVPVAGWLALSAAVDARDAREAACRDAIASAQTISANSRAHWDETQALVNAGAASQYADQREDAVAIVNKTVDTIAARERVLEAAQARFHTAVKGCDA